MCLRKTSCSSVIDISQATDGLTRQPHSTPCERVNEMSPDGTTSWFELVLWQSKANEWPGFVRLFPVCFCLLPTAFCLPLCVIFCLKKPGWRNGRRYGLKIR